MCVGMCVLVDQQKLMQLTALIYTRVRVRVGVGLRKGISYYYELEKGE